MFEITRPERLDHAYADVLRSPKRDFVSISNDGTLLAQHGAALVDTDDFPGWPDGLPSSALNADDAVIETFVVGPDSVSATSDNEPFVSAWQPIVAWMNATVRAALTQVGVDLVGDAYVTASLTSSGSLEGMAHVDDDQFVPADSVSMVAIIGQHGGPRVATSSIAHPPLRQMAPIVFDDDVLDSFAANQVDHCACDADELVVFPQFGQLHAGPAAHHVSHLSPTRQLLVMRAPVSTRGCTETF